MVQQQISFKYRIYPKQKQIKKLLVMFSQAKDIHNELVALNVETYKSTKKGLSKFDYDKHLSGRHNNTLLHSQTIQNVYDRVSKSFKNFFRRVKDKSCKKKGFPRIKKKYRSLTYPQSGFKFTSDKRLFVSKVGNIPIVLHRVPKGIIKTMTIKRNSANQWFVFFSNIIEISEIKHPSTKSVGIDVNSKDNFCYLSDGQHFDNPKYLVRSQKKLQRLQRTMSRRKKGSCNRFKARIKVARCHLKITNQRDDFQHQLSAKLVKQFSVICVEDLNIKSMIKSSFNAKFINDASWRSFLFKLSYKAVMCCGQVLENPKTRGSSIRCSKCGYENILNRNGLVFKCLSCGYVCHSDFNASCNHLINTVGLTGINACGLDVRPSPSENAFEYETGTINETC